MKRLITICAVAALVLGASATTRAGLVDPQRIIDIDFTDDGADHGYGELTKPCPWPPVLSDLKYSTDFWEYSGPDDPTLKASDRWVYGDKEGRTPDSLYYGFRWEAGKGLVAFSSGGTTYPRVADALIAIKIDNWDNPDNYKDFYIEWTGSAVVDTSYYKKPENCAGLFPYDASGDPLTGATTLLDSGGEWYDGWQLWRIQPNPASEVWAAHFHFAGGKSAGLDSTLILESLHIETSCIPEPATIALLGLGALSLLRVRRKTRA